MMVTITPFIVIFKAKIIIFLGNFRFGRNVISRIIIRNTHDTKGSGIYE